MLSVDNGRWQRSADNVGWAAAPALAASGGMVPEFVNPKYATPAKDVFKSPTRLECMMQDFPKLLPSVIRTNVQ